MKAEDVPQQWRTLMIGIVHEALDDNMLAAHYADIECMVDEGTAAVAPLIAAAERDRCIAAICDAEPAADSPYMTLGDYLRAIRTRCGA